MDAAFKTVPSRPGNPPVGYAMASPDSNVTIEWLSPSEFRITAGFSVSGTPSAGMPIVWDGSGMAWSPLDLAGANSTTGTLPVSKGGTGRSSLGSLQFLIGDGAAPVNTINAEQAWYMIGAWSVSSTPGNLLEIGLDQQLVFAPQGTPSQGQAIIWNAFLGEPVWGHAAPAPISGLSVLGVAGNASSTPAAITNTTDHHVLRRSGASIGWGPINLAQANATVGSLPVNKGGTGASSFTSGAYLRGNGTGVVTAVPPATVWANDIGPQARAAANTWTGVQTFNAEIQNVRSAGPVAPTLALTGNPQSLTLDFTANQVFTLIASTTGTTNLSFVAPAGSRVIHIIVIGFAAGRVLNWPSGVSVFPPSDAVAEASYTVPNGVRTAITLVQVDATTFYRVTG